MPANHSQTSHALRWLCWLPLASLVALEIYVRRFDGWGAWSAAPLLLLPGIVSVAIVALGVSECTRASQRGAPVRRNIVLTSIAALPLFWLGVRRFFT